MSLKRGRVVCIEMKELPPLFGRVGPTPKTAPLHEDKLPQHTSYTMLLDQPLSCLPLLRCLVH